MADHARPFWGLSECYSGARSAILLSFARACAPYTAIQQFIINRAHALSEIRRRACNLDKETIRCRWPLVISYRGGDHILVLCDTYQVPSAEDASSATELKPHPSNNRVFCDSAMRAAAASAPVFSCQQQYTLLNPQTHYPVGKQHAVRGTWELVSLQQAFRSRHAVGLVSGAAFVIVGCSCADNVMLRFLLP